MFKSDASSKSGHKGIGLEIWRVYLCPLNLPKVVIMEMVWKSDGYVYTHYIFKKWSQRKRSRNSAGMFKSCESSKSGHNGNCLEIWRVCLYPLNLQKVNTKEKVSTFGWYVQIRCIFKKWSQRNWSGNLAGIFMPIKSSKSCHNGKGLEIWLVCLNPMNL